MRIIAALGLLLGIAACAAPAGDPRASITRTQIERSATPLMFAELPALNASGQLRIFGKNGDVVSWKTTDSRGFSFQNGVLVSTRGLSFDLMSADVSGTLAALSGAAGDYQLFHSTLDGENQTQFRSFVCTMDPPVAETIDIFGTTRATFRHEETCRALGLVIENTYWTGGGTMWKTRQWVSDQAGYLVTERLVP